MRHSDVSNWFGLEYEEENETIMLRARGEIPPGISTGDYPVLVNLYWRVAEDAGNGMPSAEELERMLLMDDLLNEIDGPEIGFMMFSLTGSMRKEWIWYVKDDAAFLKGLKECLAGHDLFPIEIETGPADEWASYKEIVESFVTG
jgi:hypothetical protein